jgi:hypothetical protein
MAAYYFRNSGTDWNTAANWSLTDGGGATGAVPTVADDVFFTVNSGNCIMGANRVCRALSFTGYTSTLTVATFTLTTNNNITFQPTQSSIIVGTTGTLACNTTATITSNGGTWPLNFTTNPFAATTITLADDMRVTGSFIQTGAGRTMNGNKLYIATNVTMLQALDGTTDLVMNGSGTYSGTQRCNLEIDSPSGNIIITGTVQFQRRFIITSVGTITMTSANFTPFGTIIIDVGGRTIGNLTNIASTVTFLSDIYCTNHTTNTAILNGPGKIYVSGNFNLNSVSPGTAVYEATGSGTITGNLSNPIIINSSGTYTLVAPFTIRTGAVFTYTSGGFNTGIVTVTVYNGTTFNTPSSVSWYSLTILAAASITINQQMVISNNLTLNGTTTFTGSAGWNCNNLLCSTNSSVITLQEGLTYNTSSSVNMLVPNSNRITMQSSSLTNRAIWTLSQGASQSMVYVNGTRIDSSLGQTVWSFGGTLNNTINWNSGSKPRPVAWTFVN